MAGNSVKNISCETCKSRHDSLFSHFNCSEVDDLNSKKECAYYKKKQPIFLAGSFPRGVYCLNKGKVKIFLYGSWLASCQKGNQQLERKNGRP